MGNVSDVGGQPPVPVAEDALQDACAETPPLSMRFAGNPDLVSVAAGSTTLAFGSKGDGVAAVQAALLDLGYRSVGTADGAFGRHTQGALAQFQQSAGLPASGALDAATLVTLDARLAAPAPAPAPAAGGQGVMGSIDLGSAAPAGDSYRSHGSATANVAIHALPPVDLGDGTTTTPLAFRTSMMIDVDGGGTAWKRDPAGQPSVPLKNAAGGSVDPTVTPYMVLPGDFRSHHPEVHIGDLVAVAYNGKVAFAQYGDVGPRGKIGEASAATAAALGINTSPTSGGVDAAHVTYVVFPGSGDGTALSPAEIARRGAALFAAAGGQP